MKKEIILAGGGGHALSLMELNSYNFAGYLSPFPARDMPIRWLGSDNEASQLIEEGYLFHIAFIYNGLPVMKKREELIDFYKKRGAVFATLLASSAIVTSSSSVGEGTAIMNGAIINRSEIGNNSVINTGAIIEHDSKIGNNTFIAPGVVTGGFVNIGSNCFIGLGAKIRNGVRIADHITVAMGAVVTNDLTEEGIYHGNPLRLHKLR